MGKTGKKGGKRLKKKELAKMLMELFQNNPAEVYDIKRLKPYSIVKRTVKIP